MSTAQEALARIAALCDKHDERWAGLIGRDAAAFTVPQMRAILADVDPFAIIPVVVLEPLEDDDEPEPTAQITAFKPASYYDDDPA